MLAAILTAYLIKAGIALCVFVALLFFAAWLYNSDERKAARAMRQRQHNAFEAELAAERAAAFGQLDANLRRVAGWFKRRA